MRPGLGGMACCKYPRLNDWKRRAYRTTCFRTSNNAGCNSGQKSSKVYLIFNWDVSDRERKLLEAERDALAVCAVLVELGCRVIEHLVG